MSAAELLAIVVGTGGTGRSAIAVGQAILESAGGSLRRIAAQPVASLTAMHGVGAARAATVHAALELCRRMASEGRDEGAPMRSPREVYAAFASRLQDLWFGVGVARKGWLTKSDVMNTLPLGKIERELERKRAR